MILTIEDDQKMMRLYRSVDPVEILGPTASLMTSLVSTMMKSWRRIMILTIEDDQNNMMSFYRSVDLVEILGPTASLMASPAGTGICRGIVTNFTSCRG